MRLLLLLLHLACFAGCTRLRPHQPETSIPFVALPGGIFVMGDVFEGENEDATPVHDAVVAPFEIARYETTFAQYDAFATATGRPLPDDAGYGRGDRAVVGVTWYDARDYCAFYGLRLPTEAEWEYAARSGGRLHRFAGADSAGGLDAVGRYLANSVMHSFPVGSKNPNAIGLFDMSGNVFEWVGAYYETYPSPGEAPVYKDLEQSAMRILRGGGFTSEAYLTQTFWRSGTLGDVTSDTIGFRCAR